MKMTLFLIIIFYPSLVYAENFQPEIIKNINIDIENNVNELYKINIIYEFDEKFLNENNNKKIEIELAIASCSDIIILNNLDKLEIDYVYKNYVSYFYQKSETECPLGLTTRILVNDLVVDQFRKFFILENFDSQSFVNENLGNLLEKLEEDHVNEK